MAGEEGDEGGVGAAVGGWGGEGEIERAVVEAGDGVAPGSGVDADGEGAAVGCVADGEVGQAYLVGLKKYGCECERSIRAKGPLLDQVSACELKLVLFKARTLAEVVKLCRFETDQG